MYRVQRRVMEPKSNQSSTHVAAMETGPAASKRVVVVGKNNRGFKSH